MLRNRISWAVFFSGCLCCAVLFFAGCKQPVNPEQKKDIITITYDVTPRAGAGFTQSVKRYETAIVMSASKLKYEGYEFGGWKQDKTKPELYMPGTAPGQKLDGTPWPENQGGSIKVGNVNITLYDVWVKVVDPRKLAGIWKVLEKNGKASIGYFAFNGFKYEFWPDRSSEPPLGTSLSQAYEADGEKVRSGGTELFRYAQDRDENGADILIIVTKDGTEYRCRRDASQVYSFTPAATEAGGVTITAYAPQRSSSSLAIPAQILGLNVTAIYTRAFYQQTALTSVTIPAGVKTIGDEAFSGCGLSSVTIPDTVTLIGARAFQGNKFTAIAIPPGLKDLAVYPDGTDTEGKPAAYPPGILGIHVLPAGLGEPAPDRVYTRFFPGIGAYAFADSGLPANSDNTAALTFTGGSSAYSIGEGAFARAKIGGNLTIPAGVRDFALEARAPSPARTFPGIGANAFDGFKTGHNPQNSLSALDFASGSVLETIGNGAFRYNKISAPPGFPASLVKIGEIIPNAAGTPAGVFEGNPLAGALAVPGTVKEIGPYAFANPYAYVGGTLQGGITDLSLADGIERIGDGAFAVDVSRAGATNTGDTRKGKLISLSIPAGLQSIGRNAFMNNKIAVLDLSGAAELADIGAGAFSFNSIGKLANLPPKLTRLGDGAFKQNFLSGLDNDGLGIDLSGAAGITEIGASVFAAAKQLKAAVIPERVTRIRKGAFAYSRKLEEIDLPETLEAIEGEKPGEGAFYNTVLTRIIIRRAASTPIALPASDRLFGDNDAGGAFRLLYAANPRPGVYEWRQWEAGDPPESDDQKAL
ncbi:MAG: leucine-rich repeat domain-containing protein, partial [Treponema sp.]|nr:leucine-rich repeat domain-containing protein [Treponema sp.]